MIHLHIYIKVTQFCKTCVDITFIFFAYAYRIVNNQINGHFTSKIFRLPTKIKII